MAKRHVKVTIESREDGGVSVSSEDLPGLILAGADRVRILAAIEPAARAILERKGEDADVIIDADFVSGPHI